ncbi:nucleotidyltransferase [Ligilactobacillus salitolerans]|uniref:tRNA(Met) cytidine acetate ligase n=1 Tax=Ligilactobacillus salitolerans TaxID=1808352 RepID=A0A401IVT9_9LACO|nr:nucleotidyltransferase [Ligilactobacillus salitolerans]GBG95625.1 nucleotidyltransferase [Ligilactobacillus salitolerans]
MSGVVGIIAEYNPFHNGHLYQLEQVKKRFPDDLIVIAMSGNFLQRGEPACLDKWSRARQALENGADLVLELPTLSCVQPADRFAFGGVSLLNTVGADKLFFGAEHSNYDFMTFARQVADLHGNFQRYDESYAKTFQAAITETIGHPVDQPNDLLGLAYAKANLRLGEPMRLYPLQRVETSYHDLSLHPGQTIASASAIRKNFVLSQPAAAPYMPAGTFHDLEKGPLLFWNDFWPLLRYRIISSQISDLQQVYGMTEGIEYRLLDLTQRLPLTMTFEEWVKEVKTKRFTYTHLARLAVAILLDIKQDEVAAYNEQPYLRLLGFNERGQKQLAKIKKDCDWPIYSRVSGEDKKKQLAVDYRAGKVYQLFNGQEQDLKRAPFVFSGVSRKIR